MKKAQQIHIFIMIGIVSLILGVGVGFVIKKQIEPKPQTEEIITKDLNEND